MDSALVSQGTPPHALPVRTPQPPHTSHGAGNRHTVSSKLVSATGGVTPTHPPSTPNISLARELKDSLVRRRTRMGASPKKLARRN